VSAPEQNEIRVFHNDDAAYERFVEQFGGYVLTERQSGGYMLHEAECGHLGRDGDVTLSLTKRPRRWARNKRLLIDWAAEQGDRPQLCQSCM
jgi:hypothetical protein